MRASTALLAVLVAIPFSKPAASSSSGCMIVPMVFFDFMSAELSANARTVVGESVKMFTHEHGTRMLVTGYCDAADRAWLS